MGMDLPGPAPGAALPTVIDPAHALALRALHQVVARINAGLDLQSTLDAVAQGAVDALAFQVAVVNLVADDGHLDVVAVAGVADARDSLLGRRGLRGDWERLLSQTVPVGALRVRDGRTQGLPADLALPVWSPEDGPGGTPAGGGNRSGNGEAADGGNDQAGSVGGGTSAPFTVPASRSAADGPPAAYDDERWHPDDLLLAPLRARDGGLLGVLSVDVPTDGRRPDAGRRELLEIFAGQASIAVENARLHAEVVRRETERTYLVGQLEALVRAAPVPIIQLDLAARVELWNPEAERVFGWTEQEVLGQVNPIVPDRSDEYVRHLRQLAGGGDQVSRTEAVRRRRDGSAVWVDQSWGVVRNQDGSPAGYIGVYVDMTARRRLEDRLRHEATHDTLTGLANRAHVEERIVQALARGARHGSRVGLLLLDLDDFKEINDRLGHAAGDEVLRQVAHRLRASTRPEDTVGRLGGDEFVVLLEDQEDDVSRVADRVARSVRVGVDGAEVTASVGFALSSGPTASGELLRQADASMYAVKRARRVAVRPDRSGGSGI